MNSVIMLSWCLAPDRFPFPHGGASPQWILLLSTCGTRSSAAILPPALLPLLVRWCGLQAKVMFSGVIFLEIVSFQL